MKPIFEISDPVELLALWRLIAEAKFHENPEDTDLWRSPFVHSLSRKISDAMLESYRLAGKYGDVERHEQWLNSLPDNVVLPAVKAKLKRDAQGRHWPLTYEAKAAYVEGCIAPFLATNEFIRQMIDDAEAP